MASPISKWPIFSTFDDESINRIRLAIVFGHDASEAIFLTDNDGAFVMGNNKSGCLGLSQDQATDYIQLTKIDSLSGLGIKSLAYGYDYEDEGTHVLALTESGRVIAWGRNDYYQLGHGTRTGPCLPAEVSGLLGHRVVQVACGEYHSLALTSDGVVFAWGQNNSGQIGLGTKSHQRTPAKVTVGLKPQNSVATIACGRFWSAAILNTGQLYTWGFNGTGVLGLGNNSNFSLPTPVDSLTGVAIRQVAYGYLHALALSEDGSIYSWGRNTFGQLGTGTKDNQLAPVKVGPDDVKFIEVAANPFNEFSAAVSDDGHCWAWGQCRSLIGYDCVVSPVPVPGSIASSIHDVFAVFAQLAVTSKPIVVCQNQKANINLVFDDSNTSDLKFILEGRAIHVHKTILAIKSQHIKTMLDGEWVKKDEIKLDTYYYQVYHAFLKYLYTDQVDLPPDQAVDLFDLAKSYFHDDLKNKCDQIIRRDISKNNAATVFATAIRFEANELEEICFNFILDHFAEVTQTEAFKRLSDDNTKNLLIKAAQRGLFNSVSSRRVAVGQKRKLNKD